MIDIISRSWEVKNISGIIFDKDGTLIDSHIYWGRIIEKRANALIDFYSLEGEIFPELCLALGFSVVKKKLLPTGPIGLVSRGEVIQIINRYLNSIKVDSSEGNISNIFIEVHERFSREIYDYIKLLPGVRSILKSLSEQQVKCAIVTSDIEQNAIKILEFLGLDNYFDAVLGKDSTKDPKKTGAPAVKAVEIMSIKKNEAITIGDAPMDIIMAKNAHLKCGIGVTTGQTDKETFQKHTPYIVNSLEELNIIKI